MRVGSLFSGIGGFDLGFERAGMSVRWQVENNEYCNRVLTKHWPDVVRYGDIKTINWSDVEPVDVICGGFPCQPFSCAGKRRGQDDDRYLWPEVVRCLDTLRPTWFLGENVPGLINLALDQVCTDLESIGYTVWPVCIPACAVDAAHRRERLWIVAYTERERLQGRIEARNEKQKESVRLLSTGSSESLADVADANHERLSKPKHESSEKRTSGASQRTRIAGEGWWTVEPSVGRVADGVPARVGRLRGLGNAIVPQIAEEFGRMIMELGYYEDLV